MFLTEMAQRKSSIKYASNEYLPNRNSLEIYRDRLEDYLHNRVSDELQRNVKEIAQRKLYIKEMLQRNNHIT